MWKVLFKTQLCLFSFILVLISFVKWNSILFTSVVIELYSVKPSNNILTTLYRILKNAFSPFSPHLLSCLALHFPPADLLIGTFLHINENLDLVFNTCYFRKDVMTFALKYITSFEIVSSCTSFNFNEIAFCLLSLLFVKTSINILTTLYRILKKNNAFSHF